MFTKANVLKFSKKTLKKFKQFSGFEIIRLKDFLKYYQCEIEDMGYDFSMKYRNFHSPYEICCLVDRRENIISCFPPERKKVFRKASSRRRHRMKRQYYYENVFNRIHGYVMLESIPESGRLPDDMKIVSLSLICSSSYSDKKGVGSCLMNFTIDLCKTKFSDIVLEVANEFADVSDISDDESDEDSDEEEYDDTNDEIVERLTSEFVRKSLRLRKSDGFVTPYFNVGEEYIENILYSYMNDEHDVYDYVNDFNTFDIENPGEYDYGGIHYQKGKTSQKVLFQFYEKFGFVEKPEINYQWKLYTPTPFPTMILSLTN